MNTTLADQLAQSAQEGPQTLDSPAVVSALEWLSGETPNPSSLSGYLELFQAVLQSLDKAEFTNEKLTRLTNAPTSHVLDVLVQACSEAELDLATVGVLISCFAFVTNNSRTTKEYLFEHGIVDGVQALLLHPKIVAVFEQLFTNFDFAAKATNTLTNAEFASALLSALLTLASNFEDVQAELARRGVLDVLCELLERARDAPKELTTVYATVISILGTYVDGAYDQLPAATLPRLVALVFDAPRELVALSFFTLQTLTRIAGLHRPATRDTFAALVPRIFARFEPGTPLGKGLLLLFKAVAGFPAIPIYDLAPHLPLLFDLTDRDDADTALCASEALIALSSNEECARLMRAKLPGVFARIRAADSVVVGSLLTLVAALTRSDDDVETLCESDVLASAIQHVDANPHDERSLFAAILVLSAASVSQRRRDYLVADVHVFEVLERWYHRTENQVIIFNNQQVVARLVRGSDARTASFLSVPGALESVVETATYNIRLARGALEGAPTDGELRDARVAYEAARLLCSIAVRERTCAERIVTQPLAVEAIAQLASSPHDVLRREAQQAFAALVGAGLLTQDAVDAVLNRRV